MSAVAVMPASMTSREIAELTGKDHAHVIRDIRTMIAALKDDPELVHLNETKDARGYTSSFALPKALTLTLVSGYNVVMRKRIIDRWLELESAKPDPFAILSADRRALVELLINQSQIEARQAEQAESIKRIEAKQSAFEDGHSFFTVIGFCALRGVKFVMADMQRLGKLAAIISREMNIPIDKVRDIRYGAVNAYHESALDTALGRLHGGM